MATIISAVSGVLPAECILFSAGTTLMAVWELRPNIERLRQGTERKINQYIPKGGRDVISQGERR